jgi:two-component system response regulator FixJ
MALDPTVHIVDDDRAILDSLSLMLTAEGYTVRTYELAQTFLAAIRQDDCGCVVTDVRMPEIGGLELLAALKRQRVSMPVIVMTAHGDIPLAVAAMRQGAVDFFEKPFDGDALLASIREALIRESGEEPPDAETCMIQERLATLSMRETQVLAGLLKGQSNKIIAYELGISTRTVEVHRANVMTKMQAGSLSDLVRMALAVKRDG